MSWVMELIENLPIILEYVAPGFLLINLFMWVIQHKFNNPSIQVVSAIVASAVLLNVWDKIASKNLTLCGFSFKNTPSDTKLLILCAFAGILGIVSAILYKSRRFNNFLAKIGIYRTTNNNIWDDAVGDNAWISVYDEKTKLYYCGQFRYCNNSGKDVIIALATYYIAKKEDDQYIVVEKHLEEIERLLMLNINKYDNVIVSHDDPLGIAKAE